VSKHHCPFDKAFQLANISWPIQLDSFFRAAAGLWRKSRSEIGLQGGTCGQHNSGSDDGTETAGFLLGYRYHFNRWLAAESVYGYSSQLTTVLHEWRAIKSSGKCPSSDGRLRCESASSRTVQTQPHLLAEGGALVFDPTNNAFGSVPRA